MRAPVLAVLLCAAGAACKGESGRQREPAAEATASTTGASAQREAGGRDPAGTEGASDQRADPELTPTWRVRIPSEPGMPVLQASVGPVLVGDLVIVGSSAIGFAALEQESGELVWQRRGEERPGRPLLAGDELWLPGWCAHADDRASDAGPALGCVERVGVRDGRLRQRLWVVAPGAAARDASAGPLGMLESGQLLWANGGELWVVDRRGRATRWLQGDAVVLRASQHGDRLWVASEAGVTLLEGPSVGAGDGARSRPRALWQRRFAEVVDAGLAGPTLAGTAVAWVRDGLLEARDASTGRAAWTAEGRYAYVDGCLLAAEDALLAVALDGGVSPVRLASTDGRRLWRGERMPAIQVLAAAFSVGPGAEPALVVAARLDTTMRRDAIALFGGGGRLRGIWHLPEPQRARVEVPGVAAAGEAAYVFYEGRVAARLPLATGAWRNPATPSSP